MPWDEVENYTMTNCNHTVQNAFVEPNCTTFLAFNHGIGQCEATVITDIQNYNSPVPTGGSSSDSNGNGSGGNGSSVYVLAGGISAVCCALLVAGYILWDRWRSGKLVLPRLEHAGPRYAQVGAVPQGLDVNDEND